MKMVIYFNFSLSPLKIDLHYLLKSFNEKVQKVLAKGIFKLFLNPLKENRL